MNRAVVIAIASLLLTLVVAAQDKDPVISAVRNNLQRGQQNLVGAAQEMPADKYGFKASASQMSFGQMVNHTAGSNMMLCSRIAGEQPPQSPKLNENSPKDQLVQALKQSFDFCSQALQKVNDSQLATQVPFFGGRQVSRAQALIALSDDWADHYSLAATYLRMNGLVPPSAKKKE